MLYRWHQVKPCNATVHPVAEAQAGHLTTCKAAAAIHTHAARQACPAACGATAERRAADKPKTNRARHGTGMSRQRSCSGRALAGPSGMPTRGDPDSVGPPCWPTIEPPRLTCAVV